MPRLEEWRKINVGTDEEPKFVICGDIYDDEKKRFEDGSSVRTSVVEIFDTENSVVVTRNTTYTLGSPIKL